MFTENHRCNFTREKIAQAVALMENHGLDLWITLCRETNQLRDPALSLIYSGDAVWLSAFIVAKNGENIAIVGRHDADSIRQRQEFETVIGYDEDFRVPFLEVLDRLEPLRIGLNYSLDDSAADGLTFGLWLHLKDLLSNTPYTDRLTSAAGLISDLRGMKTTGEIGRLLASIECAQTIIAEVGDNLHRGLSEYEISRLFKNAMRKRGVKEAWSTDGCPAVSCGPASIIGHSLPSQEINLAPGMIVRVDFGVIKDHYASDLQRVWYLPHKGEKFAPPEVQRGFDTVRLAITRAAEALKPGVLGYEIDRIARQIVLDAGYPEFMHALGHQVGQQAHDGGSLLAPLWPRYGNSNREPLQVGNVFTLELGVPTPAGYVGLEEMIVIEEHGCRFLSHPQEHIWVLER